MQNARSTETRGRYFRKLPRRNAATFTLAAGLAVPVMVHSELTSVSHPTWDQLLDRIGQGMKLGEAGKIHLRCWVHDLVMCPDTPQPALLLTGPECSGKHTFHEAMRLLLPDHSVVCYSQRCSDHWAEMLQQVWLMVMQGHPERFIRVFGRPRRCNNRCLKWCITHTQPVEPISNVQQFEVRLLPTTIPRHELMRRLEREREAFRRTLTKFTAAGNLRQVNGD